MAESKTVTLVPLNGSNYGTWKVQCRMALVKDGLWSIVSGSETAPASTEAEKYAKFVSRRDKALAIIVLSVDPSLLYLLGDPEDPVAVWKKLSDQFQKKSWANKLFLRRRLNNLRLKEGNSISIHIKSMTEIFNELAVIGAPMEEEDKVVTLLASLPETYNMLVTALEASTEVPQMELVTERLLYEEKKLNEKEKSPKNPNKVMVALRPDRRSVKCHHCGKFGHIRRFCKDLNKDKGTKDSKSPANKGNQVGKGQSGSRSESLGLVLQSLTVSACGINSETWIVDSGATSHMCNNKALLEDLVELSEPVDVMLGDGKILNAVGSGVVTVHTNLANGKQQECKLHNVLFVPNLSYNLLSVSKVAEAGKSVSFEETTCNISRSDGEIIAIAKKVGCLYYLDIQPIVECSNAVNEETEHSNEMLWHQRYGHLGAQGLKKLASENLVEGFNFNAKKDLEFCDACVQGKLHRCSFPNSGAKRASEPLGLVHSDVCGKINTKSCGGAEYFLTFTDDKTRYVWVYPLKQKSEVFSRFLEWKAVAEKSSGHELKTLRTDNGGEFTSTEFENYLKSDGVKHELTVPKTPEQNGVAERLNRTLVEAVRAMLVQSKLPPTFWVEALSTAVYLHNRSPTKSVANMTPFEAWTGVKPDVKHLRSFGCIVYAHIPKDERKKLDPKAKKCVLLGYGTETKGYRLYDPQSSRVIYSRDVKFNESEFGIEKELPDRELQADQLINLELSNDDDNVEEDETNYVEFNVRQPVRERRAPDRFGEWVTVASEDVVEPTTVREALSGPNAEQWREAMQHEIDSLQEHDVLELTELPKGRKAVGCKWVFKIKRNADGSVERYKARLVAQGFSQRYGVDYDETFSPVVRFESIRTVVALAVQRGLKLHQMDVISAFLNGELEDEVYMKQPEGFAVKGKERLVCKLNKSLYGLKQSSRCWNSMLDEHLKSIGFTQTVSDPCIYVKEENGDIFIVAIHVDDIILAGKTDEEIAKVKESIAERFQAKDMGELKYILGLQVIHENGKIWIGQPTYTESILKKFGMENCKTLETPVDPSSKLVKATEDSELFNKEEYQSAVGSLLYLSSATRPDITFAVNNVAKFSANPTKEHWTAVKRIFRYLRGTVNYGLLYTENGSPDCVGFSDADWAGDLNDRKSTSGYTFLMNGAAVSWRSKKQTCVALSTAEAEYIALSAAAQEALWMRQLLANLNVNFDEPVKIYEDNQSAICMSKNPQFHGRSKHIDIKYHFVRDQVEKKTITVRYCPTGSMLADIFTKGIPKEQFKKLRELIGVKPS